MFYSIFVSSLICVSLIIIVTSFFLSIQSVQFIGKIWILFILTTLKLVCKIGWNIKGVENIPEIPFVMVANHQSPWESFFLQTLFLPTSSIMKKEILLIPFFGWAISRLKPISINRKLKIESLKRVTEVGGQRIRAGFAVLVFPEGTRRNLKDGIGKFGNSCGVLASNESVPIIPICHNSGKYWLNKSFKKKSGDINVVIGRPILGSDPKKLTEAARVWIEKTYSEIN
ncbi:MAG: 1-acyl-sn-glycerol-3-phosphate acyltransferase [Gammaproteobacteria bacterium TMED236]|nr:MAG: 1-acyl-sn-glycerol-3-phosphate acyltransferase [Gammaproteobacteria bacterium TMED236]